MRRLIISAFLLATAVSAGCGDSKNGGVGNGDDGSDSDDTSDNGGKKDAGSKKDGGKVTGDAGVKPVKDATVVDVSDKSDDPFVKDATDAAGLSGGDLDKLKAGGDCSAKILYPYKDTIFPKGLTPPTIMWDGPSDGAYIKLSYEGTDALDYQAAAGPKDKGELNIDPTDWNEIVSRTTGKPMKVVLNTMTGGTVSSCEFPLHIAQGAMTGQVFFNTYNHPDKLGAGAVVRLQLGQPESEIYLSYQGLPSLAGPCISCHSVSKDGSTLAASLHNYTPIMWSYSASSYDVGPDTEPQPKAALPESTFGALTPTGKNLLSMGNPECTNGSNAFARSPNNFPLVPGPAPAELHDTATGNVVATSGLNKGWYMWMPQFAPKGDRVVFNHAKMGADGRTDRRELAVMKYDDATKSFSDLQVIVTNQGPAPTLDYAPVGTASPGASAGVDNCARNTPTDPGGVGAIRGGTCTGPCYPAWPFFTPDGEGVVYTLISEPDFMSAIPGRDTPAKSELWYVDIDSGDKVRLDTANKGLDGEDTMASYFPTMLPVQVGGYFWLFWTSTHNWGHRDLSATPAQIAANWFGGGAVINSTRKRIWVSAIKPRAKSETGQAAISDTSSPGFYLEGQTDSGNVRAFATLNPCQDNGASCTSGLDCCSGYCNIEPKATRGVCGDRQTCSKLNEKCTEDTDCCPSESGGQSPICVGNYCGFIAL